MKKCICCGETKSLSSFYVHKQMKDGRLNKCKICCKNQSKKRHYEKAKNPEWVEKERQRSKEKYYRLGYKDKQKEWNKKREHTQNHKYKNLRRKLRTKLELGGKELHHWNYDKISEVFVLDKYLHRHIHTKLIKQELIFIDSLTNELLDTKEKHENFIKRIIGEKYLFIDADNI